MASNLDLKKSFLPFKFCRTKIMESGVLVNMLFVSERRDQGYLKKKKKRVDSPDMKSGNSYLMLVFSQSGLVEKS